MSEHLFHFSEDGGIALFKPRPVMVPASRPPGLEWLNGPLVWAIDAAHSPLYLFPRDCPRIVIWRLPHSTAADVEAYWQDPCRRMVAFVEEAWLERMSRVKLYRYVLPKGSFLDLNDAGMHVSRSAVKPAGLRLHTDLPGDLDRYGVELRALPDLRPLRNAWQSSLHVSGIRLRNARNWRG